MECTRTRWRERDDYLGGRLMRRRLMRRGRKVGVLSSFVHAFHVLKYQHVLNDLEGRSKTQLERHEEMVVPNQAQGLAIYLVLRELVHVRFVAQVSEKVGDIIHRPPMYGGSVGVRVRWSAREKAANP